MRRLENKRQGAARAHPAALGISIKHPPQPEQEYKAQKKKMGGRQSKKMGNRKAKCAIRAVRPYSRRTMY